VKPNLLLRSLQRYLKSGTFERCFDSRYSIGQEAARQRALRRGRATLISALVVALLMLALSIVLLRLASPQPRSCCALPSCFLRYWPSVEFYSYSEALTTLPGTQ
jgi:hypothetical protein